jgi:hypothetical protein
MLNLTKAFVEFNELLVEEYISTYHNTIFNSNIDKKSLPGILSNKFCKFCTENNYLDSFIFNVHESGYPDAIEKPPNYNLMSNKEIVDYCKTSHNGIEFKSGSLQQKQQYNHILQNCHYNAPCSSHNPFEFFVVSIPYFYIEGKNNINPIQLCSLHVDYITEESWIKNPHKNRTLSGFNKGKKIVRCDDKILLLDGTEIICECPLTITDPFTYFCNMNFLKKGKGTNNVSINKVAQQKLNDNCLIIFNDKRLIQCYNRNMNNFEELK